MTEQALKTNRKDGGAFSAKLMNSSNEFLREKLYTVGRVTVDGSFHTQNADEEFFRFFGNDVIYSIKRTVDEEDFPRLEAALNAAKSGNTVKTAVRMTGVDGSPRWILASVRKLRNAGHEPLYSVTLSDIFSLEALAYSREQKAAEYRHILSLSGDLAFEYSFETRFIRIYMFDSFRELILVSQNLREWQEEALNSGYIPARFTDNFNRLCDDIENGVYRFSHEFESSLLTAGKAKETSLFRGITRYDDPEHRKVTGIISIVSSRQKTKEINLTIETNRDSISELYNKNAVTEYARNLLASKPSHNVSLIILDIDNFTHVNNTYGHLFGDEVIYTIAHIIKNEIGERGVAGRIGGGNYLIVVEDTHDETDLRAILRAVRTKTEYAFNGRFENFVLTCSMGISTYPIDSESFDELFMQADKALYIAKEKGRNRYVIYDVNKHGPVEKDIEHKIAFISSSKDSSAKLGFLGDLADMLVSGKIPDISVLLEQVRSVFAIDDICIFAGNDMNLLLSCGNAACRNAAYILKNGYTERFSGDGVFTIDNVNELEGRDDNAFEQLTAQNIGGAVQYLITENNMVKGLISFCYISRFKKWAVNDVDYLTVIGRTISAILKKHSYIV